MTEIQKLNLLNIKCVKSEIEEFDQFYDFKFKDQIHNECKFTTHVRIFADRNLNILEFGEFLTSLKTLHTIEKKYKFYPYIDGELIFSTTR
jgi:hypothetical protein